MSKEILKKIIAGSIASAAAAASFSIVYLYYFGLDYYDHYAESVNSISSAQALAVAKKYLVPDQLIVIAVGDRAKIEPELQKLNLGAVEIRDPEGKPIS